MFIFFKNNSECRQRLTRLFKFILGRKLDVEMSGGRKGNSNRSANITTTKLHVAGVGMNPNIDEVKRLFEEYGTVREGQGKKF